MRYYFVNKKDFDEEFIFDLVESEWLSPEMMSFAYALLKDNEVIEKKKLYITKTAGRYFSSFDMVTWKKIPRQDIPRHIVNINQEYSLYRGFKPSGLGGDAGGGLLAQMPGKITEIFVKPNTVVKKGDPLLILEAMKMENVIKAQMDGKIKKINVKVGDTVEKGVMLIDFEQKED
jgi:biotin carboxyl carrier protein